MSFSWFCCKRWRGQYDFDQSTILYTGGMNRNDISYRFSNARPSNYSHGAEYPGITNVGQPRRPFQRYGPPRVRPRCHERDRRYLFDNPVAADNEVSNIPQEELCKEVHVISVDLHKGDNSVRHHTDRYECTERRQFNGKDLEAELVVRRGDEFLLTVELDRPYNKVKHDMKLVFKTGDRPLPSKGTFALCELKEEPEAFSEYRGKSWGVRMLKQNGRCITVAVYPPPSCPIGEWEMSLKTIVCSETGSQDVIWYYESSEDITILLNPWCKDDVVYLADDALLEEYILNDCGVCYRGSWFQISAKPWHYGQFDNGILDASLFLLRKGLMFHTSSSMGDPIMIARALSRIVNSNDNDMGVIMGSWNGNFNDGRAPASWSGSVKILRQYMKDPSKPVKYGQCWVYANLLNTVCRAVGLPCRCVTCFASAHDSDFSLTIDKFFMEDASGEPTVPNNWMTCDSVWNFHVWNEVWMSRRDLVSNKYDGWQVIDSTPQERSDGVYRLGPAPVAAVKRGDVDVGYDTPFVFSEVNADVVHWKQSASGDLTVIKKITDQVGLSLSTHRPTGKPYRGGEYYRQGMTTDLEREVITNNYKYAEGSPEERAAVLKAVKFSTVSRNAYEIEQKGSLDIKIQKCDDVTIGGDVSFSFVVKNKGVEKKKVGAVLMVTPTWYNGALRDTVHKYRFDEVEMGPSEGKTFTSCLDGSEAFEKIGGSSVKINAYAYFSGDSNETVQDECDFRFQVPTLKFKGPCSCHHEDVISVVFSFKNPLKIPLTKCVLDIEGSLECVAPTTDPMPIKDIASGEVCEAVISVRARKTQRRKPVRELSASFYCKELPVIDGKYEIIMD